MPQTTLNVRRVQAGTILLFPEQEIETLYKLRDGMVRKYYTDESGKEITIHFFRPPAVLPLSYFLARVQNQCYYQTLTPCSIEYVSAQTYQAQLQSDPDLLLQHTISFAHAISGLTKRVIAGETQSVDRRLKILREYLDDRFPEQTFTHQQLADWLGVSREAVTRSSQT